MSQLYESNHVSIMLPAQYLDKVFIGTKIDAFPMNPRLVVKEQKIDKALHLSHTIQMCKEHA